MEKSSSEKVGEGRTHPAEGVKVHLHGSNGQEIDKYALLDS